VRLFAAIIVLLHHSRGLQYPDLRDDPLFHYSAGFMDFGRFAVVIFFAISGFLVTPGLIRTSVVDYAVHRSVRIFPGLVVNVLITIFVLGAILTTHSLVSYFTDPQTYYYVKNISTWTARYLPGVVAGDGNPVIVNGALWTLHFEVLCYVGLGFLGALGLLSRRSVVLTTWCACYAAYIAISLNSDLADALPGRLSIFVSLYVYFGCGVLLFLYRERIPFSPVLVCAALGVLLAMLPLGGGAFVMPICLPYLMVFCGLSSLPAKVPLKHDLSYGVYLIHAPILVAFSLTFPNMHTWPIGAAVVFFITSILAYLSWVFIESPSLKRKKAASNWVHRGIERIMRPFRARTAAHTRPAE
jgi:peptidoglycan/LPS O-acetylase OafA/YrhL